MKWFLNPRTVGNKIVIVGNGHHSNVVHVCVVDCVAGKVIKSLNLTGPISEPGRSFIRFNLAIKQVSS